MTLTNKQTDEIEQMKANIRNMFNTHNALIDILFTSREEDADVSDIYAMCDKLCSMLSISETVTSNLEVEIEMRRKIYNQFIANNTTQEDLNEIKEAYRKVTRTVAKFKMSFTKLPTEFVLGYKMQICCKVGLPEIMNEQDDNTELLDRLSKTLLKLGPRIVFDSGIIKPSIPYIASNPDICQNLLSYMPYNNFSSLYEAIAVKYCKLPLYRHHKTSNEQNLQQEYTMLLNNFMERLKIYSESPFELTSTVWDNSSSDTYYTSPSLVAKDFELIINSLLLLKVYTTDIGLLNNQDISKITSFIYSDKDLAKSESTMENFTYFLRDRINTIWGGSLGLVKVLLRVSKGAARNNSSNLDYFRKFTMELFKMCGSILAPSVRVIDYKITPHKKQVQNSEDTGTKWYVDGELRLSDTVELKTNSKKWYVDVEVKLNDTVYFLMKLYENEKETVN
jgi:hypothetical protein